MELFWREGVATAVHAQKYGGKPFSSRDNITWHKWRTMMTSPTASGKGLRRLAQCVWMAGCDCGVVVFFGFSCDVEHVLAKIPIVDSSCGHTKSSPIGVG